MVVKLDGGGFRLYGPPDTINYRTYPQTVPLDHPHLHNTTVQR